MTVITHTLRLPDGTPWANRQITIGLLGAGFQAGGVQVVHVTRPRSDSSGLVTVDLQPTAAGEAYQWNNPDGSDGTTSTTAALLFDVPASGGPYTLASRLKASVIPPGIVAISQQALDAAIAGLPGGGAGGVLIGSDDVPFLPTIGGGGTPGANRRLITEATAEGTLATMAEVNSSLPFRDRVYAQDVMKNYRRGAPGEDFALQDGAMVVPEKWSSSADPTLLPTMLDAFCRARHAYSRTRTSSAGSSTLKGLAPAPQGVETELMFTGLDEWHFGPAGLYPQIGFAFKRLAWMLLPGTAARGLAGQTRFVSHDMGLSPCNMIGTSYRNYDETPLRANGDSSFWGSDGNSVKAYQSGGTGQAAAGGGAPFVAWVFKNTPNAVITADVTRGTSTVTVDNVDGIPRAFFTANSLAIPAALTANPMKVGDWVVWTQGQNPIDAHERRWIEYVQIKAINGTFTPGFTASGPGTITLSRRAAVDCLIADQFWSFPIKYPRAFHKLTAANGGIDNVQAHSLTKIDMSLWCQKLYVGGIDFVTDPASNPPNNFLAIAASIAAETENITVFDPGVNGIDFNACVSPFGRNLRMLSSRVGGQGLLLDCGNTRDFDFDGFYPEGFAGSAFQAETFSNGTIRHAVINNDNPSNPGTVAVFLLNEASLNVHDLIWYAGRGGQLVARGIGDDVQSQFVVDGDVQIISPNATSRATWRASDFAPGARIKYTGWNVAGTAPQDVQLGTSREWKPCIIPFLRATGTVITAPPVGLPPGVMREIDVTMPASTAGLKSLVLRNGLTADVSLLGRRCTDLTNPAIDSLGDGVGTAADRTFSSAGGQIINPSVGDPVVWRGGNYDGTDFVTTVLDVTGAPAGVVVNDLPPRQLFTGQVVTVGDTALSGTTTRMSSIALGFGSPTIRASFNLGKLDAELAGNQSTIIATFDATATDLSGDIVIKVKTFPVRGPLGSPVPAANFAPPRPVLTGDAQGNDLLLAAVAALRGTGVAVDNSGNSGKARGWDFQGLVQPFVDSDASTGLIMTTGTIYFVQFNPTQTKTLSSLWALVGTAGVLGGAAACTYYRIGYFVLNAAGDKFVESGATANDITQFSATARMELVPSVAPSVALGQRGLFALLLNWTGTPTVVPRLLSKPMTNAMGGIQSKAGITGGYRRFGIAGTGQAALPTEILVSALTAGGTGAVYMGGA